MGDQPIGEVIEQLRKDQGMTRAQLADACGLMVRSLGRIENGEHPRCEWGTVIQILRDGLGVHLELTFRKPDNKPVAEASFTPDS